MLTRAHTMLAASLALALTPTASAQLFGDGGFLQRWNGSQWNMPADTPLTGIPGRRAGYAPRGPFQPEQIYLGIPQEAAQQLPMPQLRNTGDRYDAMVTPMVQGVANFVQPLPAGAPFAQSLRQNLVQPEYGTYLDNQIPANLPAVAQHMQANPGIQFSQQGQAIANGADARLHPALMPPGGLVTGMLIRRGQERAKEQVLGSLGRVGTDAAVFGMNYWPNVGNVPNYVAAGRTLLGGGDGARGGAPAQDMPQ